MCSPFPLIVISVPGNVLPDDSFCEKAGCRAVAAFGLWLLLTGSEGVLGLMRYLTATLK